MNSKLRRVLFGVTAKESEVGETLDETTRSRRDVAGPIVVPLIVAFVALGGVALGSFVTSQNNKDAIAAQKEQDIEQFRRDQRQEQYATILQQATRLENAGTFSAAAVSSGLLIGIGAIHSNQISSGEADSFGEGKVGRVLMDDFVRPSSLPQSGAKFSGESLGSRLGGVQASWQDAYTALDQAIANAEIASSSQAINYARALRDKYRNDYHRAIAEKVDVLIGLYPDPKPDRKKLVDALVGVPPEDSPPSYDVALLEKSTDELTTLYVRAAKSDLGLDDR